MLAISYYCPATGKTVEGWAFELDSKKSMKIYDLVGCTACHGIHLINLATSQTLAGERRGGWVQPGEARRAGSDDRKKITSK
jgi:hypothetical protein